jgi:hypothetical protein
MRLDSINIYFRFNAVAYMGYFLCEYFYTGGQEHTSKVVAGLTLLTYMLLYRHIHRLSKTQ